MLPPNTDSAACGPPGASAAPPPPLSPGAPSLRRRRAAAAYQVGLLLLQLQDELAEVLAHLVGGHVLLQLLQDGGVQLPPHVHLLPDVLVGGLQISQGSLVLLEKKSYGGCCYGGPWRHGAGAHGRPTWACWGRARPSHMNLLGAGWPYHMGGDIPRGLAGGAGHPM